MHGVSCLQLVMFAGLMRKPSSRGFPILQSTQMHVVDLSVKPLRWRTSTVINISAYGLYPLAFPCTGAATVPDQKVVALKHNKVSRTKYVKGGSCLAQLNPKWRAL
jgi:hypothetical protein